jgi:hypothetical protein
LQRSLSLERRQLNENARTQQQALSTLATIYTYTLSKD